MLLRIVSAALLTVAIAKLALTQTYTIKTIAGRGWPAQMSALSARISPNGVAVDRSGNVYIATGHLVLRTDSAGGLSIFAGSGTAGFSGDGGPATNAQLNSPHDLVVDVSGNLYIQDKNNFRVRKITGGIISTVAGGGASKSENVPATSAIISSLDSIALDAQGNLYIGDGAYRVRKVSNGNIVTVAGSGSWGFSGDGGPATAARIKNPWGIAVDAAGNLYIADGDNDRVRMVSNGIMTTLVGNGRRGYSGDGGPVSQAQISHPTALAFDSAGNLFIADVAYEVVRKVSNGIITTVAGGGSSYGDNGTATIAQLGEIVHLAFDQSDNLFMAAGGAIRKVSAGTITTVAGNDNRSRFGGDNGLATQAPLWGPNSVVVDAAGNMYIADSLSHRIRKITGGIISTVTGVGTAGYNGDGSPATAAQVNAPSGMAIDNAGNLYFADRDNNSVRKLSNGSISTIAGTRKAGYSGDGGSATAATLSGPSAVAVDTSGNVYIADRNNHVIRKVSGGRITTVAGSGKAGYGGDGGPATAARLQAPSSVAVDAAGNLYVADTQNHRIRCISNGNITTVAGTGFPGFSGDGAPANRAQLRSPIGVAMDWVGNLYIADLGNNRIRMVSDGEITTVAGNGDAGFSGDNNPAIGARISEPNGIAVDNAGTIYFADYSNHIVRQVSGGTIKTVAGNVGAGPSGGDNGPVASAQIWSPRGVAVDAEGSLYIAATGENRVRKVSNGIITTVAGNGSAGFSGDNGPATSAQLNSPVWIAIDTEGSLYINDNSRVRKVSHGIITTIAGGGTSLGDNGPATSAKLNYPAGITVDALGNLFIADGKNYRIRMVANGTITTIAGNGNVGYSGDNGPATSARIDYPGGLAVDNAGRIYIADAQNQVIRMVAAGKITTVAGTGFYDGPFTDYSPATNTPLAFPSGVAVNGGGNLYIADTTHQYIRKVAAGIATIVAGNGTWPPSGPSGDEGPAKSARLTMPQYIAHDSAGNIYLTDTDYNLVRVLVPSGPACTYSVSPLTLTYPAAGGSATVKLQTADDCWWLFNGAPNWITNVKVSSLIGSGPVTLTLLIRP